MKFLISEEDKNKSGIYKITNTVNGKFYIGSAVKLERRYVRHKSDFNLGRKNPHFLAAWRLYGGGKFIFELLEFCSIEERLVREQYYLDTLRPWDREIGYNANQLATSGCTEKRSEEHKRAQSTEAIERMGVTFTVIDPTGEIFTDKGVNAFCKKHNLCGTNFTQMLLGTRAQHCGWHLPSTPKETLKKAAKCSLYFKFLDPDGVEHEIVDGNLAGFSKKHNISVSSLSSLWHHKRDKLLGWTRFDYREPIYQETILLNDKKKEIIYSTKESIKEFAKRNKLDYCKIIQIFNKKRLSYKGWILKERESEYYKYRKIKSSNGEIISILDKHGFYKKSAQDLKISYEGLLDLLVGNIKEYKGYTLIQ